MSLLLSEVYQETSRAYVETMRGEVALGVSAL